MVWLHPSTKIRKDFGLRFHWSQQFATSRTSNMPKKKSMCYPPISSMKYHSGGHGPQWKLKEHLQQVGFIWSYSHEDLLPIELIKQQVLVKYQIPTPDQMSKIDKEVEIKKSIKEKNKVASEWKNIIRIKDVEESSHHLQCPCIALILTEKTQKCHLVDLPL